MLDNGSQPAILNQSPKWGLARQHREETEAMKYENCNNRTGLGSQATW